MKVNNNRIISLNKSVNFGVKKTDSLESFVNEIKVTHPEIKQYIDNLPIIKNIREHDSFDSLITKANNDKTILGNIRRFNINKLRGFTSLINSIGIKILENLNAFGMTLSPFRITVEDDKTGEKKISDIVRIASKRQYNQGHKEKLNASKKKYNLEHKEENQAYYQKYYQEHKEEIKASKKKYNLEHKEEKKAYYKKYRDENKDKRKAYYKKYNLEHKEELKAYYQEHKEELNAYSKKYNLEHKEELKAYYKKYRDENKDKRKAYSKKYYQEHKEEINAYSKKYNLEHKEELKAKRRFRRIEKKLGNLLSNSLNNFKKS